MQRNVLVALVLTSVAFAMGPAFADSADSLLGQFTFNWHIEPGQTKCAAVDAPLLARFKSDAFQCEMEPVTNTASGEPARVCTEKGDGAEYLVFSSMKSCELERTEQASNSE